MRELGINPHALFFDTTNACTFMDSTSDRPDLPRRGHHKQHRYELGQVGLGLLISHPGLLDQLAMRRLTLVLRPSQERPRRSWQFKENDTGTRALSLKLVPVRAPFCDTDSTD